jgi:4-amino-4-deoxy-L-arabinose transferase
MPAREAELTTSIAAPSTGKARRLPESGWALALLVIAALLPIWLAGMFGRGDWKPDEPREADISWRMSLTGPQSVPQLAGRPFVEKPPLGYWLSGAAIAQAGTSPWVARLPNLLYALVFATALALLARAAGSARAALVAAFAGSSFLLTYQVAIWLATDAPLVACVAVSLLGMHRGYRASTTRQRVLGYSLMHVALALGFLAKSAAAWPVPVTAFIVLVVWEKRYRELLRWELYAGLVLQVAIVAPWLVAVGRSQNGSELLKNALWFNVVGRLARLSGHGVDLPRYSDAHRNSLGKYFLEMPFYVLPWTFLVIAAARRSWFELRANSPHAAAWRFAIATTLPSLLLLSLAATARGIYAAPSLIGVALAIALWSDKATIAPDSFDLRMLRASSFVVAGIAVLLLLLLPLAAIFYANTQSNILGLILGAVVLGYVAIRLVSSVSKALRAADVGRALTVLFASYCAVLIGLATAYFPAINREQDLRPMTSALRDDLQGRQLVLLAPDETTEAVVDMASIPSRTLDWAAGSTDPARTSPIQDRECVLAMTQFTLGPLYDFMRRHGVKSRIPRDRVDIPEFSAAYGLHIEREYVVPDGRHYVLLSRTDNPRR